VTAKSRSDRSANAHGLLIVNTGDGKGKTTAAMGLAMRAVGQGLGVCVIQFIKDEKGRWGERMAAEALRVEWHTMGDGFVFDPDPNSPAARLAREGWRLASDKIASGAYSLVVLDEFTYPLKFGWLDETDVLAQLASRPGHVHVAITGRDASPALIAQADLVTEMVLIKHPFERGVRAQRGIEF